MDQWEPAARRSTSTITIVRVLAPVRQAEAGEESYSFLETALGRTNEMFIESVKAWVMHVSGWV